MSDTEQNMFIFIHDITARTVKEKLYCKYINLQVKKKNSFNALIWQKSTHNQLMSLVMYPRYNSLFHYLTINKNCEQTIQTILKL